MAPIARRYIVSGRVQGVGFRWHVHEAAVKAGACGFVRNLPDGRVEALAEGEPDAVTLVERALRTGPAGARVTSIDTDPVTVTGAYDSFQVTR